MLDWQVRTAFAAGCAGAFVFAWTDEWHRGGYEIEDWDFGLTTRERGPSRRWPRFGKAFAEVPFRRGRPWPRVPSWSAATTAPHAARHASKAWRACDVPRLRGDRGRTTARPTARRRSPRSTTCGSSDRELRALERAQHGLARGTGEIVAYIDDDAYPDPHWLHYLAYRFVTGDWVGVGGPNIAPPGDGPIAECVANAPGGPIHVLVSDHEAEHIPGCNMAFRREALEAIGGFDPRYRAAGDDVDLCWRLQQRGGRIGFHARARWTGTTAATRSRTTGGSSTDTARPRRCSSSKWPEHYSPAGHLAWSGRLYGRGFASPIHSAAARVYCGVWGSAAYQSLYRPAPVTLLALPLMPEWYLVIAALATLSLLSLSWPPLRISVPLAVLAVAAPFVQAALAASRAAYPVPAESRAKDSGAGCSLPASTSCSRSPG